MLEELFVKATAEELKTLFERLREGCPSARERLIYANLDIVIKAARKLCILKKSIYQDLLSVGVVALISALDRLATIDFKNPRGYLYVAVNRAIIKYLDRNVLHRELSGYDLP